MATKPRDIADISANPGGLPPFKAVSRNLNGQRLGRKGRDTRDRILAAAAELVAQPGEGPVSLSAVARKASLGMTSIYVYFNDLTELLLAVLEPVAADAEMAFIGAMRRRWPDETLAERCMEFVVSYHAFWERHSRILHLRNSLSDQHDDRMMLSRVEFARPVIALLVEQMDGDPADVASPAGAMAAMLMTGLERAATVATDRDLSVLFSGEMAIVPGRFHQPGARLLELAIRETRKL